MPGVGVVTITPTVCRALLAGLDSDVHAVHRQTVHAATRANMLAAGLITDDGERLRLTRTGVVVARWIEGWAS